MNEIKTRVMIIKKYLAQLYDQLDKQFHTDIKQYNMISQPGSIRIDALGNISKSIRSIELELKQIEDSISLAEDMVKGLEKDEATNREKG